MIINPTELRRRAMEALVRELGFTDAMRFLLQTEPGAGDYTRDREKLLPTIADEELLRRADERSGDAKDQ